MGTKKLTPDQEAEIEARYKRLENSNALAKAYRVSPWAILHSLRSRGVQIRKQGGQPPEIPDATRQSIRADHRADHSIQDIALKHRLSHRMVRHVLESMGERLNATNLRSASLAIPEDPALVGYLAGLIDGEGSIEGRVVGGQWGRVHIHNTSVPLMAWLESLGGSIHWQRGKKPHDRTQPCLPCGTWTVTRTRDVYRLLVTVLPYLRIKHEKAQRVISEIAEHRPNLSTLEAASLDRDDH